MKRFYSIILLCLCAIGTVWADIVEPQGNITVWGTMGEGTNFTLDLVLSGSNPGIIEGSTIYHRKNGATSSIALTGLMSDTPGKADTYHFSLRENVRGKICGNFDFDVPAEALGQEAGMPVQGRWWLGQKEMKFTDVKVNGMDFLGEYEGLGDIRDYNGSYGYCYASAADKNKLNTVVLSVYTGPDSTNFVLNREIEGKEYRLEFRSDRGYGSDTSMPEDCWTFHLGNVGYKALCTDRTLAIVRVNPAKPGNNGLPKGVEIEGVYPRLTYYAFAREETKVMCEDEESGQREEAIIYGEQTLIVPCLAEPERGLLQKYLNREIGGDVATPYWSIANHGAVRCMEGLDTWEDMQPWQSPWQSEDLTCNVFNLSANYLTLHRSGCQYMGGAHGMPFAYSVTMDRKTGEIMTWKDWFTNPDAIAGIIDKAMHEQNDEVEWDADVLSLPYNDPWFDDGEFHFIYQVYEVAPYCYGMPSCSIPLKTLLPYLTAHGKKVAK